MFGWLSCLVSVVGFFCLWSVYCGSMFFLCTFFFQAEDGIRDLVRSRGLGDVYKRQDFNFLSPSIYVTNFQHLKLTLCKIMKSILICFLSCLLYTSDAADERSSVDLGGRRIIKKKNSR